MTLTEEEQLNLKRIMEQSLPFHDDSHLLRDIYGQWNNGKILTDRQKRAFVIELNLLQVFSWQHGLACECGRHETIYIHIRVLKDIDIKTFTGHDGINYALRRGNVVRLPLANAGALVMRRYADFRISTALELMQETP